LGQALRAWSDPSWIGQLKHTHELLDATP